MKKRILALIPARYQSSRFPGKPLAIINGKPMIQRVYEQTAKAFEDLCVATDDQRIADAVAAFGGKAVMTATTHNSGTERCLEALHKFEATSLIFTPNNFWSWPSVLMMRRWRLPLLSRE